MLCYVAPCQAWSVGGQWGRGPGGCAGGVGGCTLSWPAPPSSLTSIRSGGQVRPDCSSLNLNDQLSISDETFVCLDYVDLGFDDIMREESAGPALSEDRPPMSEAVPGHYPETEEAEGACQGEGDIISDIERIQRALSGDETGWRS